MCVRGPIDHKLLPILGHVPKSVRSRRQTRAPFGRRESSHDRKRFSLELSFLNLNFNRTLNLNPPPEFSILISPLNHNLTFNLTPSPQQIKIKITSKIKKMKVNHPHPSRS